MSKIQTVLFFFSDLDVANGNAANGKVATTGGAKVAKKGIYSHYHQTWTSLYKGILQA